MLGVVRVPEVDSIESFALHRRVRIEPDVYFNLTSMSEHIVYRLSSLNMRQKQPTHYQNHLYMRVFPQRFVSLKSLLIIML